MPADAVDQMVYDLLQAFSTPVSLADQRREDRRRHGAAGRKGIPRNMSRDEAAVLLAQLAATGNFSFSPSGKAITAEITPRRYPYQTGIIRWKTYFCKKFYAMNSYFQTPPVVKNLIIINALVYMATALIQPAHNAIMEYCALWLGAPLFHTYQFVTYMFVHANFEHIFFNMFALWMFGRTLEYELGSKRFLTYYMVCGIGAALIQYFTALAFGELPMSLVGAFGRGDGAAASPSASCTPMRSSCC